MTWPHPLALAVAPVPVLVLSLLAHDLRFPALVTLIALLAVCVLRPRRAPLIVALVVGLGALSTLGLALWLPGDAFGERAVRALTAAARILAAGAAAVATGMALATRRAQVCLISQWRVPYRLVTVMALGPRLTRDMQQSLRHLRAQLRLRCPGRAWWRLPRLVVPTLAAALRRADTITLALESRAFGAHETMTLPTPARFRARDVLFLVASWAVVGLAWWLCS